MAISGGNSGNDFSDINITPLADVFLILFLIMIVIAPIMRETALKVEPPKAKHGQSLSSKSKVINLEISEEGVFALNGKKLNEGESIDPDRVEELLAQEISKILEDPAYKEVPLNVITDRETRQKFVVGALDAAAGLGIGKLNIVTVSQDY
jgi:biopolymer transport protein ExbD